MLGSFNPGWMEYFDSSNGQTAWINSLATGIILMIGPVASYVCDRVGARYATVIGKVLNFDKFQ